MAFFRAKCGDKTYELDKLTLGDARVLKRHFGLDDVEFFNPTDPDQAVGLLVLCLQRERPEESLEVLTAEVEALDVDEFAMADEPDPTEASATGETESKPGKSAKPRKTAGTPA